MATLQQVTAEAAEAKAKFPTQVVGAAEKAGNYTLLTGSNRSRLNSYRRMGYATFEFNDGEFRQTFK